VLTVADERDERGREAGRMQAIYRDVNERIVALADGSTLKIICECGWEECADPLVVPRRAFVSARASGTRFLVKAGHVDESSERVVAKHDGFVVIEKFGEAGGVAEAEES
jgi:predicted RecB family endonuclease